MNERQLAHELAELATEGVPTAPDLLPHLQTHLAIADGWPRLRRRSRARLLAVAGAAVMIMLALATALTPTATATANQVLGLFGFTAVSVTDAHPSCVRGDEQRTPDFVPVPATPIDVNALSGAQWVTYQGSELPMPANLTPAATIEASAVSAQMITCPAGFELQLTTQQK